MEAVEAALEAEFIALNELSRAQLEYQKKQEALTAAIALYQKAKTELAAATAHHQSALSGTFPSVH